MNRGSNEETAAPGHPGGRTGGLDTRGRLDGRPAGHAVGDLVGVIRRGGRRTARPGVKRPGVAHPGLALPAVFYIIIGFFVPVGVLAVYSFWPTTTEGNVLTGRWTLSNYLLFVDYSIYWKTLLQSFLITGISALLSVAISMPFAFFVAVRVPPQRRALWITAAILPFSVSYMIRIFAWTSLFGPSGILNSAITALGITSSPLGIFNYGPPVLVVSFVYLLFPLSFLASYVAVERVDPAIAIAAADLGARPWQGFMRIVLPIARTGIFASFALCLITMMGDYVTPAFVGGSANNLFINFVVTKFGFSAQWGLGSAFALILLASLLAFLLVVRKAIGGVRSVGQYSRSFVPHSAKFLRAYSIAFLAFLYVPIVILMLFAFNSNEFVGFPITGLTLHWFATVAEDPLLLSALRTSLAVVAWVLPLSLVLAVLAAVPLARVAGRWRSFSVGILAVPLCLPSAMLGLGTIVSLHAIGIGRGVWTIVAVHVLLVLPTATFMILVRLEGVDPNFELAAMDLGARPWQVLVRVVVPQALPAILAAALIGLTISIDEFIVTYLVTGNSVTLPLYIYSSLRYNTTPELNALSCLMLLISFVLFGMAALVLRSWSHIRWERWLALLRREDRRLAG